MFVINIKSTIFMCNSFSKLVATTLGFSAIRAEVSWQRQQKNVTGLIVIFEDKHYVNLMLLLYVL